MADTTNEMFFGFHHEKSPRGDAFFGSYTENQTNSRKEIYGEANIELSLFNAKLELFHYKLT